MEFYEEIREKLIEWGASFVGFSNVGANLSNDLKELQYAVTIGVSLSNFIVEQISDKPTFTYFHHYRTVNSLIDTIILKGQLLIQERGYQVFGVPASQTVNNAQDKYSGVFSHKIAAVKAGLGWMGKSGLFISSKYGPRVRLGTILTDLKIPYSNVVNLSSCGECRKCVENCPAMAIRGNDWSEDCSRSSIVDAKACSDYMNQKFKHIGRGSVCGICISSCPSPRNMNNER
ncbi:UNVERIFIED_CONTAM: hypothetical protein Cloal_2863 [Acetivibrio alkalicellulosi]